MPKVRISQANGITAETLKAGRIVKIPVEKQLTPAAAPVEGQPAGPPPVAETAARAGDGERNPLGGLFTANVEPKPYAGGTVDVALMLPMGTAGGNNTNFLDFYQGTLLALEDLKRQGVSIDMGLYDTERSEQTTAGIVNSQPFASADLIIGPVYEEALAPVLRFAQDHRVAVVSPLANVSDNESPLLYQLSPAAETKYDKLKTLLSSGGNVVVVYSASNDTELEEEIRPLLPANYKKLTYSGSTTASGLDDYLKGGADNIFVVLIRDEYTIDNFMARVSSVRTNLNARGVRTGNIRIVGSSRWQRFTNVDRTLFFKLNLCFVASYQADAADRRVQDFNRRYIAAFGTVPTLYAYRGYDAAKLFIGAYVARSGSQSYESALNQSTQPLLRMPYRFNQQRRGGNHVNQEWALVCYKSDFTIEVK